VSPIAGGVKRKTGLSQRDSPEGQIMDESIPTLYGQHFAFVATVAIDIRFCPELTDGSEAV
jgi:hypothetical protein